MKTIHFIFHSELLSQPPETNHFKIIIATCAQADKDLFNEGYEQD